MNNLWITLALIACGTTHDTARDSPTPIDSAPDPIPISILGHCPGFEPGTKPPAVTITGHDACVTVMLTNSSYDWTSELEVCDGYGEYGEADGLTPGTTGLSCEEFNAPSNTRSIAVSMVVDGVCYGFGDGAEWCP